jgi:hypothetical protein
MQLHIEKHRRGSNDGRIVNLSFFNVSNSVGSVNPENPSKIIFDISDTSGSILPILFPEMSAFICEFVRDGVSYIGYNTASFVNPSLETGTLEYVNDNCYKIAIAKPADSIMSELNSRGIFVFSGNAPLSYGVQISPAGNRYTYAYVYAEKKDAIGIFDPNDRSILPYRVFPR